jgi:acid stress-induced BolA-like protein IbaG/YrbA
MPETGFDYQAEAERVREALRGAFPQDTIATDEGYNGRVHVKVVSERFNRRSEREKQDLLWEILRDRLGAEAQAVSLALAYGTDEL